MKSINCPICNNELTQVENDYDNNEKQVVERQFGMEEDIDVVFQYTCTENHRFYLAQETIDIIEKRLEKTIDAVKNIKENAESDEEKQIAGVLDDFTFNGMPKEEALKEFDDDDEVKDQVGAMLDSIAKDFGAAGATGIVFADDDGDAENG